MTGWNSYQEYLLSKTWRAKRKQKLEKSGWRCENCGTTFKLQVHHLTYERLGNEKMDDLKVLCEECHSKAHKDPYFNPIVSKKEERDWHEKRVARARRTGGNWREPDCSSPFRHLRYPP